MLIYNIFIFTVAFLLYLDYLVHKYDTHLVYGSNRVFFGNSFMYVVLAVIIIFAGFRFEIGYDYKSYYAGYFFDSELEHWEPLFNFFVRISRRFNFGLDIQFMFFFFSGITILIVYKALKHLTPYYRFGLLLYLLSPYLFLNSFSVIRQGIALVILLYGLQFITTKVNYKKYMIVALIAFMFHYSSIFVAILFLLGTKFFQHIYSWVLYSFLIVISFFLSFVHIGKFILTLMPGHFSLYADMEVDVSPLKLLVINLFFLFLMLQKDTFLKRRLDSYLFNSMFIGLVIFNLFSDFIYVSRMGQYFLVAEIILVPIYLYSIKNIFKRQIMMVLFLMYYMFNFNYALYRDEHFSSAREHFLIPYKNYFFEEQKSDRNLNLEAWYSYIQDTLVDQEQQGSK